MNQTNTVTNTKSNVTQDDGQHNATLKRQNYKKHKRKILIHVKTTYLDRKKKDAQGDSGQKND